MHYIQTYIYIFVCRIYTYVNISVFKNILNLSNYSIKFLTFYDEREINLIKHSECSRNVFRCKRRTAVSEQYNPAYFVLCTRIYIHGNSRNITQDPVERCITTTGVPSRLLFATLVVRTPFSLCSSRTKTVLFFASFTNENSTECDDFSQLNIYHLRGMLAAQSDPFKRYKSITIKMRWKLFRIRLMSQLFVLRRYFNS